MLADTLQVLEHQNISRDDLIFIFNVLLFSSEKHRDQRRKDENGSPYINHPIQLVHVLIAEGNVFDKNVICGALLHDTVEDTETTPEELGLCFGDKIKNIVLEVTDNFNLSKTEQKQSQIDNAPYISREAQLVKLADKICNLRDVADNPPYNWSLKRRQEYFDWSKAVIDGLRGVCPRLESVFDEVYLTKRPISD